jgi:hypothetical protein
MTAGGGRLRPLAFFTLMCGFGLRLDSSWQHLASLLLAIGTLLAAAGLVALGRTRGARDAFVRPPGQG